MTTPAALVAYQNYLRSSTPGTLSILQGTLANGSFTAAAMSQSTLLQRVQVGTQLSSGAHRVRLRWVSDAGLGTVPVSLAGLLGLQPFGITDVLVECFQADELVFSQTVSVGFADLALARHALATPAVFCDRVEFSGSSATPSSLGFGGVWISLAFAGAGLQGGWSIGFEPVRAAAPRARSGAGQARSERMLRTLQANWVRMDADQAIGAAGFLASIRGYNDIAALSGPSEPVIAIPRCYDVTGGGDNPPPDEAGRLKTSIFGQPTWGRLVEAGGGKFTVEGFGVREYI